MSLYSYSPAIFKPILKEKIWGGRSLEKKLNKTLPPSIPIGESWELSGWGDSQSIACGGEFKGKTLTDLFISDPISFAGKRCLKRSGFPLLLKFIDATENLSVQVHPDKSQAQIHGWGENGKTECWYIIDAMPEAEIIAGFNRDVTEKEVKQAVLNGTLHHLLNYIPVKKGDVVFIPGGTVHAILGGALIYEVQEESDITLRLYDWNRKDDEGKGRELHLDEALKILNLKGGKVHIPEPSVIIDTPFCSRRLRCCCSDFTLEEYSFFSKGEIPVFPKDSFEALSVVAGSAKLKWSGGMINIALGQTVLLPANLKEVGLMGTAGSCVLSAAL
ncbi:class I mannose-6-phosphate isomerase [Chitinispirillales bacterium ANBcel5]|uniref:type I phosphomannose isomerase catalytic subunit n=1 Tax=Cellulosispirillum alkaliphilum TaxID=3039283 RepID=UPI002A580A16|nr:class I mannose-6-phosphate isomerase [Chitinispirillales bacterium ANBcel5]